MKKGTKVKMLTGQMGLMSEPDGSRFVSEVLCFGDEAVYHGPHTNPELADKGWELLTIDVGGRTLWCPAHDSQFEPVSESGIGSRLDGAPS